MPVPTGASHDGPHGLQQIYSQGIYHGLPDLSGAPNGLTAIVTGANGISGAHMVRWPRSFDLPAVANAQEIRVLASNPTRWKKIYALSRRPPSGSWPDNVQHVPLDFLSSSENIAETLRKEGIKADYVFWFAYILVTGENGALEWGDQRLVNQNSTLHRHGLVQMSERGWYYTICTANMTTRSYPDQLP